MIAADIRLSPSRGEITGVLLNLCRYPELLPDRSDGRFIEALLDLLLHIVDGDAADPGGPASLDSCLRVLVDLLDVEAAHSEHESARTCDEKVRWAAAVVRALHGSPPWVTQIGLNDELSGRCRRYLRRLLDIDALDFPAAECRSLYHKLLPPEGDDRSDQGAEHDPPPPPPPAESITLGKRSPTQAPQQSALLGHEDDGGGREVRCLLGAEDALNVICLCGAPAQGKSTTLGALISGALHGDCGPGTGAMPSTAIVFDWGIEGASKTVRWARGMPHRPAVLGLREELEELHTQYREATAQLQGNDGVVVEVDVRPVCFALQSLPDEVIIEVAGLTGAAQKHFQDILRDRQIGSAERTMNGLRNAVDAAPGLKQQTRDSLRTGLTRLEPFVATSDETPVHEFFQPGQLVVVDCGRIHQATSAERLGRWNMVLRLLRERSERVGQDEHYLLVFDELNAVFGKSGEPAVRRLAENLRGLADEGRHVHVSIVAASQKPSHFRGGVGFADDASVLLFHRLGSMGAFPDGVLWQTARTNSSLTQLEPFTVRYYADADTAQPQPLTGLAKIKMPV